MTTPYNGLVSLSGLQIVRANTATVTSLAVGGANLSPTTPLNVKGDASITGSLIVTNNFTVRGTTTTINSQIIESSNIIITNAGTGPGIQVTQTGAQDIADFKDEAGSIFKIADSGLVTIAGTGSNLLNKVSITGNLSATGLHDCITDSIATTSSTLAASATAVKAAYDKANAALPLAGGTMTGNLTAPGLVTCITDSIATTSSTLAASATAVKTAYDIANAALPLSGGTLAGALTAWAGINGPLTILGSCGVTSTLASGTFTSSGSIITGNSCSLRYWSITGTTPTSGGSISTGSYTLPTGWSHAAVVGLYGSYQSDASITMPFNQATSDLTWLANIYIDGVNMMIQLGVNASHASAKAFKAVIITSS